MDPYHGQQDTRPEPEAIDLPEELNLDQEEARDDGSDEGDGDCGQSDKNWADFKTIFCCRYVKRNG